VRKCILVFSLFGKRAAAVSSGCARAVRALHGQSIISRAFRSGRVKMQNVSRVRMRERFSNRYRHTALLSRGRPSTSRNASRARVHARARPLESPFDEVNPRNPISPDVATARDNYADNARSTCSL